MILETTFVIDFLKGKENAVSKMNELIKDNKVLSIATPTVFELFAGYSQYGKGEKEKQKMSSFIDSVYLLPLDDKGARIGGMIDGTLVKQGLQIDTEDCMIAGIAINNNEKVLTRDEHFSRVEELKIENY